MEVSRIGEKRTKRNGKDLEVGGFGRIVCKEKCAENVAENPGVKLFFSTLVGEDFQFVSFL